MARCTNIKGYKKSMSINVWFPWWLTFFICRKIKKDREPTKESESIAVAPDCLCDASARAAYANGPKSRWSEEGGEDDEGADHLGYIVWGGEKQRKQNGRREIVFAVTPQRERERK